MVAFRSTRQEWLSQCGGSNRSIGIRSRGLNCRSQFEFASYTFYRTRDGVKMRRNAGLVLDSRPKRGKHMVICPQTILGDSARILSLLIRTPETFSLRSQKKAQPGHPPTTCITYHTPIHTSGSRIGVPFQMCGGMSLKNSKREKKKSRIMFLKKLGDASRVHDQFTFGLGERNGGVSGPRYVPQAVGESDLPMGTWARIGSHVHHMCPNDVISLRSEPQSITDSSP